MRKSIHLLIIIGFGLAGSSWLLANRMAQKPQQPRTGNSGSVNENSHLTSRDRARLIEQIKADISHLAERPRFSSEGFKNAANYVRSEASAVGLRADVEPVTDVLQWERGDSDECDLILPDQSTKQLRLVALTGSAGGDFEGEVTLVNYFFDKNQGPPPHRFDEGNKKRLVFFSRRLERDRSVNGYVKTVPQRNYGAWWAAKYGAAGVLVRSVQTGDGPPHTGAVNYSKDVARIPAAALSVGDADELERLLCHGRLSQDPASSQICDGQVSVHLSIKPGRRARQLDNVVIRIPGTTLAKEIVVVGAHLDSHDITPGAADDAAGVAAVLAVMRHFAGNRPARTLMLVLFADEELGGAGARAFVKRHEKELPAVVAATEIDDGDGPPRALQITASPSATEASLSKLWQLADRLGAEATLLELRVDTDTNGADIDPLWKEHGIPEVAILQDFTNYFDKHHAINDTQENINSDGLARTTLLLLRMVDVISSGVATPIHGPIQNG